MMSAISTLRFSSHVSNLSIPSDGETFLSVNPANPSQVIAEGAAATEAVVESAIGAAFAAQKKWAKATGAARAEVLYKWAAVIESRIGEWGALLAQEIGKPIGEAKGEAGRCVAILRYYAGEAVRPDGQTIPSLAPGLQYAVRRPLGVVALVTPWNFPVAIPLWKAAPALAFGNAVVLKPSEHSPLAAQLLAESAAEAGLPEGLFSVVQGGGAVGKILLEAKDIKAVSFTGSAKTGAFVAESCARRNIPFQTEMGGKNPAIVLEDANFKSAGMLVAAGAMRFAGQKCTATSRVIVQKSVMGPFLEELKSAMKSLPIGDPSDPTTAVGPVISCESKKSLELALESTRFEKHQVESPQSDGWFVAPTLLLDVNPLDDIAQRELFGPILAVIAADGVDHAIDIANGVRFGLSASLFTQNLANAMSYAEKIEAGLVRINADTTGVDPHAPFGGVKGSSSGSREQGPAAREFYTETKTVQINPT